MELAGCPDLYPWAIIAPVESGVYFRSKVLSFYLSLVRGGVSYRCARLIHGHQLSHGGLLARSVLTGGVGHLGQAGALWNTRLRNPRVHLFQVSSRSKTAVLEGTNRVVRHHLPCCIRVHGWLVRSWLSGIDRSCGLAI